MSSQQESIIKSIDQSLAAHIMLKNSHVKPMTLIIVILVPSALATC